MSLLTLEGVSRRHRRGANEHIVLSDISLQVETGELVAVWGMRRSGRSTLLRVAAGVEPADSGRVMFADQELGARKGGALGSGIGYCQRAFHGAEAGAVLDEVLVGQLARGVSPAIARARAWAALERAGASECAECAPHELDSGEMTRVTLARALALGASLLVIDEPLKGVDLLERDDILSLLRSLADEGLAILMSASDATGLSGADRALSLSAGKLHGSVAPEWAPVVPLSRRAGRTGA
jgi:energy-coupling factor transporter ATP-binding protein EcfA2